MLALPTPNQAFQLVELVSLSCLTFQFYKSFYFKTHTAAFAFHPAKRSLLQKPMLGG